ncbi:MAG: hypothetical protein KGY61_08890 [Desulfobacterales bacterium]|nr:hypothetical protein [Desulfobacterales bacterium]
MMEPIELQKDFFEAWHLLPEDFRESLIEIKRNQDEMDTTDQVMVGPCPNCGSTNTRDCGHTSIGDPTVGFCMDCGCIGCLICGAVFNDGETQCPHWAICRNCSAPKNERGHCSIPIWECPAIKEWKAKRQHQFEF